MIWWRRRPTEPAATPAEALDEQLSAYIDGDLSDAEAAAIEARLAVEPEVRDALSGMQQVRDALVALGETAAPRAFTLEAPPARGGLPRMELFARFGAAVSALALAAVLIGDAVTTADPPGQPASAPQPVALQAAAAAPEQRATGEGQAGVEAESTKDTESAESAGSAESAAPATLSAPAAAPARATTDAADDTQAAPTAPTAPAAPAALSTERATDERPAAGAATADEPPPTLERTQALEPAPPLPADPGGGALDAARAALLALVALFGAATIWQFARRPR